MVNANTILEKNKKCGKFFWRSCLNLKKVYKFKYTEATVLIFLAKLWIVSK